MAISLYKIKKWAKMLSGKSVFHVNQDEGKVYSKTEVAGYYNNLTEKITRFGLPDDSVPKSFVDTGEEIYFSISIFQYGLAAYDLFLINKDKSYLPKLKNIADWAVDNQLPDGSWVTFAYQNKEKPYSAMAQGEGISVLIRAHKEFGDSKYIDAAKKAKEFLLKPLEEGGTTEYKEEGIFLYEATFLPLVLNGWIFAAWGLYDYAIYFQDKSALEIWKKTVGSITSILPVFDTGYWSMYTYKSAIASPFYHSLHIAQLKVLYDLTGEAIFLEYATKFEKYQKSWLNRKRAFVVKAIQKIL